MLHYQAIIQQCLSASQLSVLRWVIVLHVQEEYEKEDDANYVGEEEEKEKEKEKEYEE